MFKLSNNRISQIGISSNAFLSLSILCNILSLIVKNQGMMYFLGITFAVIGSILVIVAFLDLSNTKHSKATPKYILTAVPLNLTALSIAMVFKYILGGSTISLVLLLLLYFMSFIYYLLYFFGSNIKQKASEDKSYIKPSAVFYSMALIMSAIVILSITNIAFTTSIFIIFVGVVFLIAGTIVQTQYPIKTKTSR